jgi:hypothetical protein
MKEKERPRKDKGNIEVKGKINVQGVNMGTSLEGEK